MSAHSGKNSAGSMRKLVEVEDAKQLMTEAMDWSVFTWLWQKTNVREIADKANAALDRMEKRVKERWRDDLKVAYRELLSDGSTPKKHRAQSDAQDQPATDPQVLLFLHKVKQADKTAHRARMDAEKTFDDAERHLDTTLAKEGCRKAIHSWELHEQAIRQAEAGIASKAAT
jgi:hypothetical protein